MKIGIPDVFSAIQNHHLAKKSADIALYEPKKQVYFQLKKHLEQPFSGRTAYEKFLDIIPMEHTLSRDEVEKLKFDISHLFSEDISVRYDEAMAIFAEWNAVDWDLNELFEAIKSNDYESYFKVKSALLDDECTEKSEQVLDDLEIIFLHQKPWQNRIKYNYREIEKEYKEMQAQYEAAALALLDDMANEIECIS